MRVKGSGLRVAPLALPLAIAGMLLAGCAHVGQRGSDNGSIAPRSTGTKDNPNARAEWFYNQRSYPLDEIPIGARAKGMAQASKIAEVQRLDKAGAQSRWTAIGPLGFDTTQTAWGRQSGRVRSMAIDPNNTDRLFLGVSTGGVWRSEDAGANWTPLTDAQPSLAIGAVAVAASDSQIVYAGTGEGNGGYYSVGLLKSTDGGSTWSVLSADTFNRSAFAGLAVDPSNADTIVACTTTANFGSRASDNPPANPGTGMFRSTDGGASFTQITASDCFDLAVVADDFNVMYHSASGGEDGNGLFRSADGGQTWTLVDAALNGDSVTSVAIGVSKDGSRVYLGGYQGEGIFIQSSTDSAATFGQPRITPKPSDPEARGNAFSYCESQCGYDNEISVNPFDPNDVIFAGIGAFRSTDGAMTFSTIGDNNTPDQPPRNLHVDHHMVAYDPAVQGVVYNGNDGGVWRSTDSGATWTSVNGTLGTLQPYHLSLHPTDPNIMFTGNQDNGTLRRTDSNTWTEVFGGDGSFTAIDPNNPQIVYASTPSLGIAKSTDGGASFLDLFKPSGDPVQFVAPFVLDPSNPQVIYGGTNRLYRTTDASANFTPYTGSLTAAEGSSITGIAVAPSDSNIVYVVGSDGSVNRVDSAMPSAINAAPLPGRYATHLAVHPTDPNTVYVTFSGFNSGTPDTAGHVFKTTDAGASWTNISDNLPDSPANNVALRPGMPDEVYVATDVGVFVSSTGGGSWARMGNGLPNAPVAWLAVNGTTNTLAAATYGRSVWKTELDGTSMPPGTTNYSYTYFNASEGGWGFNVSHQGDNAFGTWYTYAPDGKPMFLTVQASETSPGNFAGPIFRVAGTPFELIDGATAVTAATEVGMGEMAFDAEGNLALSYTLNMAGLNAMTTKQLTRFNFANPPPTCVGTTQSRAGASNYSDLWWNSAESGWGLTIAHQGDVIFLLWYTYGEGGRDQWISGTPLTLQPDGSFAGPLQRPDAGTPVADIDGQAATTFPVPETGMASVSFSDGETGTFNYTLDGVTQSKAIQRFVFVGADQPKVICTQ